MYRGVTKKENKKAVLKHMKNVMTDANESYNKIIFLLMTGFITTIDETGKMHVLDFAVQLVQPSMESILIISGI